MMGPGGPGPNGPGGPMGMPPPGPYGPPPPGMGPHNSGPPPLMPVIDNFLNIYCTQFIVCTVNIISYSIEICYMIKQNKSKI